ncbi:MAG TPA: BON domain-containing protein [Verrucomicrobiae bacterium]|nr:BON domain-containing protein [Verrucomicrobiae bacterium]
MKYSRTLVLAGAALLLLAGCDRNSDTSSTSASTGRDLRPTSRDETPSPRTYDTNTSATSQEADNTGKNIRDRSDATLTPGDQGGSDSDRELTRNIRRAITSNEKLSTTAKNIKIITANGKVTLRGPVQNDEEKQLIDSIVKQAGVNSWDDQLEVKQNQSDNQSGKQ